jgi:hypothetical protein
VRIGSAKVLITVILPTYDNSLWIHEFNTDLTASQYADDTSLTLEDDPCSVFGKMFTNI